MSNVHPQDGNAAEDGPDSTQGRINLVDDVKDKIFWVCLGTGLLLGASLTLGIFTYYRSEPVNVLTVFGALAALPTLLTILSVGSLYKFCHPKNEATTPESDRIKASAAPKSNRQSPKQKGGLLQRLLFRLARRIALTAEQRSRMAFNWLFGIYGTPYYMVRLHLMLQILGISAIGCAAATFFGYVLVHDVGFGWSSTVFSNPTVMDRFVENISLPWSWLLDAGPDHSVVVATQWSWTDSAFNESYRAASLMRHPESWWRFLLLSVLVWGLIPRTILLAYTILFVLPKCSQDPLLPIVEPECTQDAMISSKPASGPARPHPSITQPKKGVLSKISGLLTKLKGRLRKAHKKSKD